MRVVLFSALLLPLAAHAGEGGMDGHGLALVPGNGDARDLLATWRPEANDPGSFSLEGTFEYAESPLVLMAPNNTGGFDPQPLLDDLFGVHLGATWSPHERATLTLQAPLWFTSSSMGVGQGTAIGDLQIAAPVTAVAPSADRPVGLALVPFVHLPTGSEQRLLGSAGTHGGATVAVSGGTGPFEMVGNVGIDFRPRIEVENLIGGPRLLASLGGAFDVSRQVAVRAETTWAPSLTQNRVRFSDAPGELLLSTRGTTDAGLNWMVGGALPWATGAGAATFRAFAGVGFSTGRERPEPVPDLVVAPPPEPVVEEPAVVEVEPVEEKPKLPPPAIDDRLRPHFDLEQTVLRPEFKRLLDELATYLRSRPDILRVEIRGHADATGPEALNVWLSQRRAEVVEDYLVSKGVAPDRLDAQGYSSSRPLDTNATAAGRALNRRVDFAIVEVADPSE